MTLSLPGSPDIQRTRVKICGLSEAADVGAAVAAGADAIGFVFYEKSPRHVTAAAARALTALLPPYVTAVGLFVNATPEEVARIASMAGLNLLQFHGDETPAQCAACADAAGLPFVRAMRIGDTTGPDDLLQFEQTYRLGSSRFRGLLLDTLVSSYGGSGKAFDWSIISKDIAPRVVLSGGLNSHSVAEAIARVRPFAIDVSSGVEVQKGVKDQKKIREFIAAVHKADWLAHQPA